jgi:hypothetical protein
MHLSTDIAWGVLGGEKRIVVLVGTTKKIWSQLVRGGGCSMHLFAIL